MLPFAMDRWRLGEGLFLEDNGILIPWLAPWNDLPNFGQPEARAHGTVITYVWKARIFSGLAATVTADLAMVPTEAKSVYQDRFRYARIALDEAFSFHRDARETYLYVRDRLAASLGPGRDATVHDLPETTWQVGVARVMAGVNDRMGDYFSMAVMHQSMDVVWPSASA
jgi:hypothetical protein